MARELPPLTLPLLRGTLSRRTLFRGASAVALGTVLAACGTAPQGERSADERRADEDMSDQEKVVNWSNWPEYIDVDDESGESPTLQAFTADTGIEVNYNTDYNDNDEFFAKVQPQLSAGQDTGRDVWCSTDWLVARLIRLGWVQELNRDNIPNADNVEASLADVEFDPGRRFSLPWQSGFTGIGYNPDATGGKAVESIDQLLTDPALRGRVTLLTEMRDTVGMVLLAMGKDPADFTDADFEAAIGELEAARDAGQFRGFTGNDYTAGLASGEIAACLAWTGDVVQLQADNPALGYTLPATGHVLWSDNFVIPNKAQHKKNAELLINHYYDPAVMADVAAWVNYIPPVQGTGDVLRAEDPDTADNQLIFPTEEVRERSHVFRGLSEEEETRYNELFQSLIGA